MGPKNITVVWKADQTILNSVFDLPFDRKVQTFPPKDVEAKSRIAEKSKMTVFDGKLALFFDDNKVAIRQYDKLKWDDGAIVYYLIYKTYLYYNCLMPENESTEAFQEVDKVTFQICRYIKRHLETGGYTWDTEPCEIVLNKKDITDYLMVIDQTILYAISYYILGCNTQQYFLIEFYKCLEVIKNHFGNQKEMRNALKPYGFLGEVYREAKKLANDQTKPLSITRHAPLKGISVQNINTRWLFSDPMGREAFEVGEKACRNIIDSYLQFRTAGNS